MTSKQLHVVVIASPGVGHLLPVLLLGHRLLTHHNLRVTILPVITTATSSSISKLLTSFTHLSVIQIPAADISSLVPPHANIVTQLCVIMRETIPTLIRTTIYSMHSRPDVLIGDIFSSELWAIAEELAIPKYAFVTCNAWYTGVLTYSPVLDKQVVGQYIDHKEPFEIPGCKPLRPEDVISPMQNRDDKMYGCYLGTAIGVSSANGILINTWEDLEPQSLDALRNNPILQCVVKHKPVYTVGPVCKHYEPVVAKNAVVEWLDKQPKGSVIYVSFGSGGTMSLEQMNELACGLELSRQRFVWVVRPPSEKDSDGSYFMECGQARGPDGPRGYLPEGFLARTGKVGLVVSSWAPQVEVLNHTSIAGFLTHCGWNSTLESITNGVPMIAWPLYAEQNMNATMLTEELKVAIRPKALPMKKVVGREEVARMVMGLVKGEEGKIMKEKVMRLKEDAKNAISKNGSSYISVCKFIEDCWSSIH